MSILLKDASVTDLLPDFLRDEPWVKAFAGALKEVFVVLLNKAQKTITYSNVDNLPDELLDILAIELQTPNYVQSYGTQTKRSLIKNTLSYHYIAGSVRATKEMIQAIFGGTATLKEWFEDGYDTETQAHGEPGHFKVDILGEGGEIILSRNIETFRVLIEQIKRKSSVLDTITVHVEPFKFHERFGAAMIESETTRLLMPQGDAVNPNLVAGQSDGEAVLFCLESNDFDGITPANENNEDLYAVEISADEIRITSGTEAANLFLDRQADETIVFTTCEAVGRINAKGELLLTEGNKYTYSINENGCLIATPKEEYMATLTPKNLGRIRPEHRGAWSINAEYAPMDVVTYGGHAYWVLRRVTGITPTDDGVNYRLIV